MLEEHRQQELDLYMLENRLNREWMVREKQRKVRYRKRKWGESIDCTPAILPMAQTACSRTSGLGEERRRTKAGIAPRRMTWAVCSEVPEAIFVKAQEASNCAQKRKETTKCRWQSKYICERNNTWRSGASSFARKFTSRGRTPELMTSFMGGVRSACTEWEANESGWAGRQMVGNNKTLWTNGQKLSDMLCCLKLEISRIRKNHITKLRKLLKLCKEELERYSKDWQQSLEEGSYSFMDRFSISIRQMNCDCCSIGWSTAGSFETTSCQLFITTLIWNQRRSTSAAKTRMSIKTMLAYLFSQLNRTIFPSLSVLFEVNSLLEISALDTPFLAHDTDSKSDSMNPTPE